MVLAFVDPDNSGRDIYGAQKRKKSNIRASLLECKWNTTIFIQSRYKFIGAPALHWA